MSMPRPRLRHGLWIASLLVCASGCSHRPPAAAGAAPGSARGADAAAGPEVAATPSAVAKAPAAATPPPPPAPPPAAPAAGDAATAAGDAATAAGDAATAAGDAAGEPALDDRPLPAWWQANSARAPIDPTGEASILSYAVTFIHFVVHDDLSAWERIAPRVERGFSDPAERIPVPIAGDPALAKRYHDKGVALTERPKEERDYAAEAVWFKKALLLDPNDADLYNHLAIEASLGKDFAGSERWAKLAIAVRPDFISAYQELAYAYKNLERYRECIAVAERGLNVDGDLHVKALLLARKGQALWMLSEEEAALSAFRGSRKLGGPPWVDSYLEGKQEIGKPYKE